MNHTSNASVCSVCEHPSKTSTCLLCDSIITTKKSQQWTYQIGPNIHDEAIRMLGSGNKTAPKRWKSIVEQTSQSKDVQWARLSDMSLAPLLQSPCTEGELDEIKDRISQGQRLFNPQKRFLQQGFQLVGNCIVCLHSIDIILRKVQTMFHRSQY